VKVYTWWGELRDRGVANQPQWQSFSCPLTTLRGNCVCDCDFAQYRDWQEKRRFYFHMLDGDGISTVVHVEGDSPVSGVDES
jgi:hypothetical protein